MVVLNRVLMLASLAFSGTLMASERYRQAAVDNDGVLHVLAEDGRKFMVGPEPELAEIGSPISLHQIRIAPDRRAVGWVVKYPNCCTAYPIPLTLVVYSDGAKRAYRGSGLPIWQWRFLAGGGQVAFRQETVHGGIGIRFELHDVRSGDLVDVFDWPVGPDNQPVADQVLPDWAKSTAIEVPEAFLGRWNTHRPPCADFATEGTLEINDRSAALYAAGGPILAVRSRVEGALALKVAFFGEDGQERREWLRLRLLADGSRLRREETGTEYFRCQSP